MVFKTVMYCKTAPAIKPSINTLPSRVDRLVQRQTYAHKRAGYFNDHFELFREQFITEKVSNKLCFLFDVGHTHLRSDQSKDRAGWREISQHERTSQF